jgi:hypothetical protein
LEDGMDIQFVGICMFDVSNTVGPEQRVFIPNVSLGHLPPSAELVGARPHNAFIAVPPDSVGHTNWNPDTIPVPAMGGGTFWVFPLDGVDITVDPAPSGGTTNLGDLLLVSDVTSGHCSQLAIPRSDLTSNIPAGLAARLVIPGGDLISRSSDRNPDLKLTEWTVADTVVDTVTITATPFGGGTTRTLTIENGTLDIVRIMNVDQDAVDEDDRRDLSLYCSLRQLPVLPNAIAASSTTSRTVSALTKTAPRRKKKSPAKGVAKGTKGKKDAPTLPPPRPPNPNAQDPFTLGPGCSNSQLP